MKPNLVEDKNFISFVAWFEKNYSPGEKGVNGNPRGAELLLKGIKGNIIIRIMYEENMSPKI